MHLTALNAKSEPERELVAEFDRIFSRESPEALQWAFEVWRERSPFFPAVCDIRGLVIEFRRGQREQMELKAKLDEKFLLEERRKQGQVPDFVEVVKQLRAVAEAKGEPAHDKRQNQLRERAKSMKPLAAITETLDLSDEQIEARRQKDRAEIRRYADVEDYQQGTGKF